MKKIIILIVMILFLTGLYIFANYSTVKETPKSLYRDIDKHMSKKRITFINLKSDKMVMRIIGHCSIKDNSKEIEIICAVKVNEFQKFTIKNQKDVIYIIEELPQEIKSSPAEV